MRLEDPGRFSGGGRKGLRDPAGGQMERQENDELLRACPVTSSAKRSS
jgi:hypothetical protein